MKSMGEKVKSKDKTEENHVFQPKICCERHLWEGVETGGSPVLCLYFDSLPFSISQPFSFISFQVRFY